MSIDSRVYSTTRIQFLFEHDYEKLLRREIERMHLSTSARALNIACEHDLVPSFLSTSVAPQNVRGIDIDPNIVRSDRRISACDVDRDRFPFDDASFDLVFSVWGIEHIHTMHVFRETHRVLKPGGRFIFVTPNLAHPIFLASRLGGEKFASWYYRRVLHSSYKPHITFYRFNTRGALRRVARDSGLRLETLSYFGPASVVGYFSFSRFLQRLVSWHERWFLTNPFLGRMKPYFLVVFQSFEQSRVPLDTPSILP